MSGIGYGTLNLTLPGTSPRASPDTHHVPGKQQRLAHEQPVIFYSLVIGSVGPVMALAVPPVRKSMGWKPAERIPTTYPVPNRPRRAVQGFEDS